MLDNNDKKLFNTFNSELIPFSTFNTFITWLGYNSQNYSDVDFKKVYIEFCKYFNYEKYFTYFDYDLEQVVFTRNCLYLIQQIMYELKIYEIKDKNN